ncbi:MAG: hypothetical protein MSJ26_04215 [Oscillospiraceae bacterium]|nr:hypothetical protein [Oscillospiraceae bacterium]
MKKKYLSILSRHDPICSAAAGLSEKYASPLDSLIISVCAPCAYFYGSWIVRQAISCGINRLYFFARDGYSIKQAVDIILKKESIPIETSYFYCSRHSLRMAAYRFFDNSAYDRLFAESYMLSAFNLLTRAEFDDNERCLVYKSIGFAPSSEHEPMNRSLFKEFCNKLKASELFRKMLKEKSDAAYENAVGYFKQEGMDAHRKFGVVDLGWTGSMQHTLKRLLESCGIHNDILGLYFGMLENPPIASGSQFIPWLFDSGDVITKAWFSQNILECIFSAPHGTTSGYERAEGVFSPVLFENENNAEMIEHISGIISDFAENVSDFEYSDDCRKTALLLLKRLMLTPDKDEAEALDEFFFCDDISEKYHNRLASGNKKAFVSAILHRHDMNAKPYWFYGAVRKSGVSSAGLLSLLYFLSELGRNFINHFIRKRGN